MNLPFSRKINKIYRKIFGNEISDNTAFFLSKLQYAVIGYGIAGVCVFSFELLAGRMLGPAEYGEYVLVSTVALFLYLFMTLGTNMASIKYGSVEDPEIQKKVVSASYLLVILASLFFGLLFLIFSETISLVFSIPLPIFRLSIIFAILLALYTISTDALRAIYDIKSLSFFRAGYGIMILVGLFCFLFLGNISFKVVVFIICFSYLIIFLLISLIIRKYFYFRLEKSFLKKVLEYGLYAVVGGPLLAFLPSIGQIFVNKYLSLTSVGVYNAYYFSSITLATFVFDIFLVVFFPAASRHEKKAVILKKISKAVPILFLCGLPILFAIQFVVLKIYGNKYPVDFGLMFLFSLSTMMICIYGLYSWFFYSTGISGVKRIMILTVLMLIVDVLLSFYLVPLFSLFGAVLATFFAYMLGSFCLYVFFIRKRNSEVSEDPHKKIKICHVASSALTIRFILLDLLLFLNEQKYDACAVCSPGKWIKEVKNRGLKVREITITRRVFTPFSDLIALIKLIYYFRKEKIDIVHTHTPKAGILGRIAAKIAGVPIIIHTNHGFHFQDKTSFVKRRIFIFLEMIGAKFSDLLLSINKEDVETAVKEKICPREIIRYSGDGINTEIFNPANFSEEFIYKERSKIGIGKDNKVIGFVGRLVKEKGILDLMQAFAIVKKLFPEAFLLVVGPQEPEKRDSINCEMLKKSVIQDNVVFLGERINMEKIYPLIDIFVLPSYREGLGLVLLEASAMAKPVIATNIRGCREAVEDGVTGKLVPVGDPSKLAEIIMYFINNPEESEKMGRNGRERTVKYFDERHIFDKINKEYQELIAKKL